MSTLPGTHYGPYVIVAPLGAGGMGEVYKARDTRLDRVVALKVLPKDMAGDPTARARFEREAKAIAALNHPNICALFDVGQDKGSDYLVMELLEGSTLQDRLQKGPLDVAFLLDSAIALADALEAAHGQGLIHRDLKPANIFMTTRNVPKILDFGLAKTIDQADDATRPADGMVTTLGTTVGTLSYMSPEQLRGEPLDARTDVFSLGLVFYEMATGQRAFSGSTTAVITAGILGQDVQPPRELRPDLPQKLEETILKALEKERDLRCQTAAELRADLMRVKREGSDRSRATAAVSGARPPATAVAPVTPEKPASAPAVAPAPVPVSASAPAASHAPGHAGPWIVAAALIIVVGIAVAVYFLTHQPVALPSGTDASTASAPSLSSAPAPPPPLVPPPAVPPPPAGAKGTGEPPSSDTPARHGNAPAKPPTSTASTVTSTPGSSGASGTTATPANRTPGVVAVNPPDPAPAGRGALGPGGRRGARGFGQAGINLSNQLKNLPPQNYHIMFTAGHPETQAFANQLKGMLDAGGWICSGVLPSPQTPDPGALMIGLPRQSVAGGALVNWATRSGYTAESRVNPALKEIHIVIGPPKSD